VQNFVHVSSCFLIHIQVRRSKRRGKAAESEGRFQRHGRGGLFHKNIVSILFAHLFCFCATTLWLLQVEKKRKRKMQEKEGKSKKKDFKF